MIDLILVFRSLKGRCRGNQFLLVLSTQLCTATELSNRVSAIFARWRQAARGIAGRANVRLSLPCVKFCCAVLSPRYGRALSKTSHSSGRRHARVNVTEAAHYRTRPAAAAANGVAGEFFSGVKKVAYTRLPSVGLIRS